MNDSNDRFRPPAAAAGCDPKQFAVLFVDDEKVTLKLFALNFRDQFRILTAPNARDGFQLLEQHKDEIGLLITDQKMPGEQGVWLLEQARRLRPGITRVLSTAHTDYDVAIAAVNSGAIHKYVQKPWDMPALEAVLRNGLELFMIQREREQLLTEKMDLLDNRIIADRVASFGQLTAGLSHHIRNPLVAVKTFLDLAPAKMEEERTHVGGMHDPDFWRDFHHAAQTQVQKIDHLLTELGSASHKPALAFPDQVHIQQLFEQIVGQLKAALALKNIQVANLIPVSLPVLNVDQPRFGHLFELLLRDEITNLPAGSQITLSARLCAGTQTEPQQLELEISDNGPSLPDEALRLVFDPFALRSDRPLEYGIDLMACYFMVHYHGGRIEARNRAGQGTTFTLRFPTHPQAAQSPRTEPELLQAAHRRRSDWDRIIASY